MNKQPAPKRPVSVLVLLHDGADHVLLLERIDRAGFWQSVTGSLENDETPVQAALREVAEETGIVLDPSSLHDWQHCVEYEIFEHWRHRYAAGVTHNQRALVFGKNSTRYTYSIERTHGLHMAACIGCRRAGFFTVQPRHHRTMASATKYGKKPSLIATISLKYPLFLRSNRDVSFKYEKSNQEYPFCWYWRCRYVRHCRSFAQLGLPCFGF